MNEENGSLQLIKRIAEAEKKDYKDAININVETMKILADQKAELKAERDQLAASLEEIKTQWREHLDDCVPLSNYREMTRLWEESGAKLDTARKALEAVDALVTCSSVTMEKAYFRFITTGQGEVIEIVRQALAQISNPTAALDERDRAVAKETARRILEMVSGDQVLTQQEAADMIRREFGLEEA